MALPAHLHPPTTPPSCRSFQLSNLRTCLLLLLSALLCSSCDDAREFSPAQSPALARSAVAAGRVGAFAGEAAHPLVEEPAPAPPVEEPPAAVEPPAEPAPPQDDFAQPEPPEEEPEEDMGYSALGSAQAKRSALVGTFYDLKLTSDGRRTRLYSLTDTAFDRQLARIYHEIFRSWSPEVLDRFYKSPTQLFASSFYLPMCDARYGPLAYQCDTDKVKPRGWVVVYRGKVRAPKSGRFRFVGTGDDFICVRFNNKLVLEAGFVLPTMYDSARPNESTYLSAFHPEGRKYIARIKAGKESRHPGYEYTALPAGWGWNKVGGLTHGLSFEV